MHYLPCTTTVSQLRNGHYYSVVINIPIEYRRQHNLGISDVVTWMGRPDSEDIFLSPSRNTPSGYVPIKQMRCKPNGLRGMTLVIPKIWADRVKIGATVHLYETPNGDLGISKQ